MPHVVASVKVCISQSDSSGAVEARIEVIGIEKKRAQIYLLKLAASCLLDRASKEEKTLAELN